MRVLAHSARAMEAYELVSALQDRYVKGLDLLARTYGEGKEAELIEWLRDEGRHGGGIRYVLRDESLYNRGSINISQVHYDDKKRKKLGSATAISAIVHPRYPYAPSMHMHISWTEMKSGEGYWRIMSDLNPAFPKDYDTKHFEDALCKVAGPYFLNAKDDGDKYFFIPTLKRCRGVSHFYMEGYRSEDFAYDLALARQIGEATIDAYLAILEGHFKNPSEMEPYHYERQLSYHTLYFFQVLTLDRGTTSGLLVHNQNDLGIMGSLPSHIDRSLLDIWKEYVPPIKRPLMEAIIKALPDENPTPIDDEVKLKLADVVRHFYKTYPNAIDYQAAMPRDISAFDQDY